MEIILRDNNECEWLVVENSDNTSVDLNNPQAIDLAVGGITAGIVEFEPPLPPNQYKILIKELDQSCLNVFHRNEYLNRFAGGPLSSMAPLLARVKSVIGDYVSETNTRVIPRAIIPNNPAAQAKEAYYKVK